MHGVSLRTRARSRRTSVLAPLIALGAVVPGLAAHAQQGAGSLVGTVAFEGGNQPVAGAVVVLDGLDRRVRTDREGNFLFLRLPAGEHQLQVEFQGFQSNRLRVPIGEEGTTRVEVSFVVDRSVAARHTLEPITVKVARVPLKLRGFERRRHERRAGVFFTRSDIEKASPIYPSDLLRGLPGVRVERSFGETRILMGYGRLGCEPFFYVDGTPSRVISLDHYIPRLIEALEVYRRPLERPPQFRQGSCGAIVLWTRESRG